MRKLRLSDTLQGIRIIRKLGLKDTVERVANDAVAKGKTQRMAGIDLIWSILEVLAGTEGEKEVYQFLSGPLEVTPEEVEQMDLVDLAEKLSEVASVSEWRDFFTRLRGSGESRKSLTT